MFAEIETGQRKCAHLCHLVIFRKSSLVFPKKLVDRPSPLHPVFKFLRIKVLRVQIGIRPPQAAFYHNTTSMIPSFSLSFVWYSLLRATSVSYISFVISAFAS